MLTIHSSLSSWAIGTFEYHKPNVIIIIVQAWLTVFVSIFLQPGDRVMVVPSLSKSEATEQFPGYETVELPSGKEYLRFAQIK